MTTSVIPFTNTASNRSPLNLDQIRNPRPLHNCRIILNTAPRELKRPNYLQSVSFQNYPVISSTDSSSSSVCMQLLERVNKSFSPRGKLECRTVFSSEFFESSFNQPKSVQYTYFQAHHLLLLARKNFLAKRISCELQESM